MGWKEDLEETHIFRPDFALDATRTALIIVDMTYLDAHPDYGPKPLRQNYLLRDIYFGRLKDIVIPNHRKLVDFFHQHNLKVIYLTVGCWLPDKSDLPFIFQRLKKYMGPPEDKASQVLDEIRPQVGDLTIHKTSSGAFNSTDIEHILRNLGVTSLVITGVATCFCVETTARDAADRGFKVVIVDDACAAPLPKMHDAALLNFSIMFGEVLTTGEVLSELERGLVEHPAECG